MKLFTYIMADVRAAFARRGIQLKVGRILTTPTSATKIGFEIRIRNRLSVRLTSRADDPGLNLSSERINPNCAYLQYVARFVPHTFGDGINTSAGFGDDCVPDDEHWTRNLDFFASLYDLKTHNVIEPWINPRHSFALVLREIYEQFGRRFKSCVFVCGHERSSISIFRYRRPYRHLSFSLDEAELKYRFHTDRPDQIVDGIIDLAEPRLDPTKIPAKLYNNFFASCKPSCKL